jgi:ribosomal protein S18 acetylase RimI-like enzyme
MKGEPTVMSEAPDITIREAQRNDLAQLVELMKALTITTSTVEASGASSLADYEKVFAQIESDPNHYLIVAEVEGQIVGSADLMIVPNLSHRGLPWAVMENVIVDERTRRQGIASAMVEHLVTLAKENGCYKIGLSSSKKRPAAHSMYESLGFKQYGLGYRIYF